MLKRNFNIMLNYHQQANKINHNLSRIKQKITLNTKENINLEVNNQSINILENNFTKPKLRISLDQLLNSKLKNKEK